MSVPIIKILPAETAQPAIADSLTVSEATRLLDDGVQAMTYDPDFTIEKARLVAALLRQVPVWAPQIAQQFGRIKAVQRAYVNSPLNTRTLDEMNARLHACGHFNDEILIDGMASHVIRCAVQVGPAVAHADGRTTVLITLPCHITEEVEHDTE